MVITHPFPPLYDAHSQILILGSFPSVKSREQQFFYGHPQNRFWRILSAVYDAPVPQTIPEKRSFLLAHRIALWDVIASCEITGSSDSSIRSAVPNDLRPILNGSQITQIYVNGSTAAKYYDRYQRPELRIEAVRLPSSSPANASWQLPRLIAAWSVIRI